MEVYREKENSHLVGEFAEVDEDVYIGAFVLLHITDAAPLECNLILPDSDNGKHLAQPLSQKVSLGFRKHATLTSIQIFSSHLTNEERMKKRTETWSV